MASNAWSRSNLQLPTDKSRTVSGKPLFSRSRNSLAPAAAKTPFQPIIPPAATKPRKPRHSDRQSLNEYREDLYDKAADGLSGIENELSIGLEDLTADVEGHFQKLIEIEEPLHKPFVAEALTRPHTTKSDAKSAAEEVLLLKDGITNFHRLNEETGETLGRLWQEWEDIQFEIIRLAVECFGTDSIVVLPLQTEETKSGQKERLDDIMKVAQNTHDEAHREYAGYQQELKSFEENMNEIANQTKGAVDEMQESYRKKKGKDLKQISMLLRQLTED